MAKTGFAEIQLLLERPGKKLILVDAEESHSVQLWQLWNKDAQKRGRVDDKVRRVVLCVEAGQEVAAE